MKEGSGFLEFVLRQSFQPVWLGFLVNPLYLLRRPLFLKLKQLAKKGHGQLLDFGCGRKPYENLFHVNQYLGVDVEVSGHDHSRSKVDVFYRGNRLPFDDQQFDCVVSFEVLEHVFNPHEIVPELNRVLKNDGLILVTVPFCWNEHEAPFDYARYSSFGLVHLLESNGFELIEVHKTGRFPEVIAQLIILYFFEFFRKWGKIGHAVTLLFSVPLSVLGIFFGFVLPRNPSLYFNVVLLARKKGI